MKGESGLLREIEVAFSSRSLEIDNDALVIGGAICTEIGLSADDLAEQWDVFSVNCQYTGAASVEKMMTLKSKLEQGRKSVNNRAQQVRIKKEPPSMRTPVNKRDASHLAKSFNKESIGSMYGLNVSSPTTSGFKSPQSDFKMKNNKHAMFSPQTVQSPELNDADYENRTDAGKTVDDYNMALHKQRCMNAEEATEGLPAVNIEITDASVNTPVKFSYMYTPLHERAKALDQQLEDAQVYYGEKYNIEEFGIVGDPSPAQVTVVGRICCDASEGKLNASVVQLEGSRTSSGGQRVLLDLEAVSTFSLFPGKIVCLEGILNSIRKPMVVKRILEEIPAPMPKTSKAALRKLGSRKMNIMAATGPFTCTKDTEFRPLGDLLTIASVESPDVLILIGPFIDAAHPHFQNGVTKFDGMIVNFQDVFMMKVMSQVNNLLEANAKVQVVLIPSLKDTHHEYVYPQPPFVEDKLKEILTQPEFKKRLHLMSNPGTFRINEVVFGVSAIDTIFQLGSAELNSFYPMFPPPANCDAPIDLRYMQKFQFKETPDVLIVPSMLNRFCGEVHRSLCINPGQLTKGRGGGTYSKITIYPLDAQEIVNDNTPQDVENTILSRACVEVKKI